MSRAVRALIAALISPLLDPVFHLILVALALARLWPGDPSP